MADYYNALLTDPLGNYTGQTQDVPVNNGSLNDLWNAANTKAQTWADQTKAGLASPLFDRSTGQISPAGQDYANALMGFVGSSVNSVPKNGLTAYHGSPHDFDAFSLDKIGTGEGAQAYGHGLYFAEHEGVARSYRDALSGKIDLNAPRLGEGSPQSWGHMYEVNLNVQPHELLDWDAPLSQQSAHVQETLGKLEAVPSGPRPMQWGEMHDKYVAPLREILEQTELRPFASHADAMLTGGRGWDFDKILASLPAEQQTSARQIKTAFDRASEPTGADAYQILSKLGSDQIGGLSAAPETREAARTLHEAGIKGIRYLDRGSRSAGEGTSNFVMFDPATIEILRKYGLAGLGLGTAAEAASQ